jgi:hypothetical protein
LPARPNGSVSTQNSGLGNRLSSSTIIAAMLGHTVDVSLNTYNQAGIERQRASIQTLDNIINTTAA